MSISLTLILALLVGVQVFGRGRATIPTALLCATLGVALAGNTLGQTLIGVVSALVNAGVAAGNAIIGAV